MNKSNFKLTTPSKFNNDTDLETKMIDRSLMKSYIFQALPKSTQKIPSAVEDLELTQSKVLKSQQIKKRNRIFKSVMRSKNKTDLFKVLMTVVSPSKPSFSCCNGLPQKDPVVVELSEFKEITIRNANETQVLYHFNFNTVEAKVDYNEVEPGAFILEICKKIALKFQSSSKESKASQRLKEALIGMTDESLGREFHMEDLGEEEDFYKLRFKPATEFAEHCETGDILLFRGNLFWAKLQRFVLNSQYDHVGMVYKDSVHGILIFESTSFQGICLTPWEYVVKYKWYNFIKRIAWRKLKNVQRDYDFMETMREMIIRKVGQAYHISFDKLLSNKSYIYRKPNSIISEQNQEENENMELKQSLAQLDREKQKEESMRKEREKQKEQKKKQEDKDKDKDKEKGVGYFCSELVAKMYKEVKILTSDEKNKNYKPSCNYYPYHFTQKFDLNLIRGELSDEYVIHFNQEEIKSYYNFQ